MSHRPDRRAFLRAAAVAAGVSLLRSRRSSADQSATADQPIIDTHQHLWDRSRADLPWTKNALEALGRNFGPEDFHAAADGLNVVKTVYMEVDVPPEHQAREAEYVIGLCKQPRGVMAAAVIGCSPHEPAFADYLKRFKREKVVKGMRTVLHGNRPQGLCLQPQFVDSMKRLGDAGLSFDLCLRKEEVSDGAKLAAQCPDTSFILDHCGNIGFEPADSPAWRTWSDGIKAAADLPNVVCKISGVIDKAKGAPWTADGLAENVDFCLDAFGEDRVLFGGDWPICLFGGTFRQWVEALKTIVATRPATFRQKLFHDNAMKVYRL